MAKLDHPNIVKLYEAFDTPKRTVLILELVTGGELFEALVKRQTPYYERDAADIIRNVLRGVAYMNSMGVCHRDLKPENLLIQGDDPKNIKITDFGLSKDFTQNTLITSCGTASYAAPEVLLSSPYTSFCDVWSVGVITFILLSAEFPFHGRSEAEIFKAILSYRYCFRDGIWNHISSKAKDFIAKIFVESESRMSAEECLEHPWLSERDSEERVLSISGKLGDLFSRSHRVIIPRDDVMDDDDEMQIYS